MLELATEPAEAAGHPDVRRTLAGGDPAAIRDAARAAGASSLTLIARPTDDDLDAACRGAGLQPVRELLQLRRSLPVGEDPQITTRPFDVERDPARWLELNNRAFAWHPDQGGWSPADLRARMAEPWFDPAGFLLHERDGDLAGFCWTKVHPPTTVDPALGEIYVIAVDPGASGEGLGRQLALAGLHHLADAGIGTAMLYVDADNLPARALYDRLGFRVAQRHVWYRTPPAPTG